MTRIYIAVAALLALSGSVLAQDGLPPLPAPDSGMIDPQTGGTPTDPQDLIMNNVGNPELGSYKYFTKDGAETNDPKQAATRSFEFNGQGGIAPQMTMREAFDGNSQLAQEGRPGDAPPQGADVGSANDSMSRYGVNTQAAALDEAGQKRVMEALANAPYDPGQGATKAFESTDEFLADMRKSGGGVSASGGSYGAAAPSESSSGFVRWPEYRRLVTINNDLKGGAARPAVRGYGDDASLPELSNNCKENAPTAFGSRSPDCPPKI